MWPGFQGSLTSFPGDFPMQSPGLIFPMLKNVCCLHSFTQIYNFLGLFLGCPSRPFQEAVMFFGSVRGGLDQGDSQPFIPLSFSTLHPTRFTENLFPNQDNAKAPSSTFMFQGLSSQRTAKRIWSRCRPLGRGRLSKMSEAPSW